MRRFVLSACLISLTLPLAGCVIEPARVHYRDPIVVEGGGYNHDRGGYYEHDRDDYGHQRRW